MSFFSKFGTQIMKPVSYTHLKPNQDVATMDMKKELEDTELVLMFFTIGNLNEFPYNATKMME